MNSLRNSCQQSKEFIKSDERMKKLIANLSGGLAEVRHHDQHSGSPKRVVQFIHQSMNDFLLKDGFILLDTFSHDRFARGRQLLF